MFIRYISSLIFNLHAIFNKVYIHTVKFNGVVVEYLFLYIGK